MVLLSLASVCIYLYIALSSFTLLTSIFVLSIVISRMRDSMAKERDCDQECRSEQEPGGRPLCLASQLQARPHSFIHSYILPGDGVILGQA